MSASNEAAGSRKAFNAGVAVAVLTSLLTVWTTLVRDDGNGIGFFMLIMTAMVGAFAAWFRPAGMARGDGRSRNHASNAGLPHRDRAIDRDLAGRAVASAPVLRGLCDVLVVIRRLLPFGFERRPKADCALALWSRRRGVGT
jgi:hypothetical protein